MQNRNLIEVLLLKYHRGELTIEELRQFNDLLADERNENYFKDLISRDLTKFTEENLAYDISVDFDEIYNKVLLQIKPEEAVFRKRPIAAMIFFISTVAAILAGVFLLGRAFPYSVPESDNKFPNKTAYTEIKAPYGSKSEIRLPDGTSVILNAGSSISYRNDFNINNRDLNLYGEAYFKAAINITLPLIVRAGGLDVIAVGTEFNIKAYPDENTIETTLIEGKVEIANISSESRNVKEVINLLPNQKAVFIKGETGYIIKEADKKIIDPINTKFENILISPKADIEKTVAWTEGKLIFRGERLDDLSINLQRKYDVKFVFIDESLKKVRFSGVLLDETLEQVLNVIKMTVPIVNYSLDGKTVYLTSKPLPANKFLYNKNEDNPL